MLNALVLSGGIALGAFEAGICAALEAEGAPHPGWVAGASAGAVNAAILAGNPPERRAARLRQFWEEMAEDPMPGFSLFFGTPADGPLRRAHNRVAALQSLLFGRPGLFTPRLSLEALLGQAPSLYDLAPLRRRLPELVDFDRLNDGAMRVTLVATDVVGGERVVFDTARGTRIGPEHVLASCALLPLFAPVEVEGRLLGDGGLSSNAPVDLVLEEGGEEMLCILAELFATAGRAPGSLSGSLARAGDLALGNQTQRLLEGHARLLRLRESLHRLAALVPQERHAEPEVAALLAEAAPAARATVLRIGYRAPPDEAGASKLFDFSRATTADRWKAGEEALRRGLRKLAEAPAPGPGLVLHEVES